MRRQRCTFTACARPSAGARESQCLSTTKVGLSETYRVTGDGLVILFGAVNGLLNLTLLVRLVAEETGGKKKKTTDRCTGANSALCALHMA